MKRRVALLTVLATLALIGATNIPAGAGPGSSAAGTTAHLQMYTVIADQAGAKAIKSGGYDIASVEQAPERRSSAWRSSRIRHNSPRSRSSARSSSGGTTPA